MGARFLVHLIGFLGIVVVASNSSAANDTEESKFEVKFIFVNKDGQEFPFTKKTFSESEAASQVISHAPWKVLIHGFLNNKETTFPSNVRKAYLESMRRNPDKKYNILIVDWGKGACADFTPMSYYHAVDNVNVAAKEVASMLAELESHGVLTCSSDVHLIGHSLGSHVAGRTSHYVEESFNRQKMWRVSGLDPAGPAFWSFVMPWEKGDVEYRKLDAAQATFVDTYHSSSAFGTNEVVGDVDVFINGGEHQPSCEFPRVMGISAVPFWVEKQLGQVCSHNYATDVFAQSIDNLNLEACFGCASHKEFQNKKCKCEKQRIGEHLLESGQKEPAIRGVAYLDTPKDSSVSSNYMQLWKSSGTLGLLLKGKNMLCL